MLFHRISKMLRLRALIGICIILFLVRQFLGLYFQINDRAVSTFILSQLNSERQIPTKDLVREDRRLFYASRNSSDDVFQPGLHRYNCGCDNQIKEDVKTLLNESSTCSSEATLYGKHQKVISYSLYIATTGSGKKFFLDGIEPNLDKIKQLFPGWLARIYTNIPINYHSCYFICKYDFLFWCDITNIPRRGDLSGMNGRTWRFLVLGDPTVDIFLSRDLDSTVSEREKIALTEWENSDEAIHVIRDSQWHRTEILAGLMGFKNSMFGSLEIAKLQSTIIRVAHKSKSKFWDQNIAKKYIYIPYRKRVMAHDSYFCKEFPDGVTRPFPTQRIGQEFVGHDDRKEMDRFLVGKLEVCPEDCRPPNRKDWTFC